MADRRYSLLLAIAVLTAGGATFAVFRVIQNTKESARVVTHPVVVAMQDIPEGAPIERLALAVNQWPEGTIPAGAFTAVDSLVGRVSRVAIYKGEPLVPGRLAPDGTGPGLAVLISPGKRAMPVQVNEVIGVSGLLQPNSRVDVLVTLRPSRTEPEPVAVTFMENMRVLSVGTLTQSGPDSRPINATTVSLEVTPAEAERLLIATREGTIQLTLRGYGDPDSSKTKGARTSDVLAQLRGGQPARSQTPPPARRGAARQSDVATAPPPPQPMAPAPSPTPRRPDSSEVKVYRGEKAQTQKFAKDSAARADSAKPVSSRPDGGR
jgi:pilus assembly protein CpaB